MSFYSKRLFGISHTSNRERILYAIKRLCAHFSIGSFRIVPCKMLAMRVKHIECCFVFGLVWSLGSTGVEAGQKGFLDFLENIIADLGVIENEWEGVNNALQVGGNPRSPHPLRFNQSNDRFSYYLLVMVVTMRMMMVT